MSPPIGTTEDPPASPSRLVRVLHRVTGRSDIVFNNSTYMKRWRVVNLPWFGVRIHKIERSDRDRELHDHPFTFLSVILSGGYTEDTIDGRKTYYAPGSVLLRGAEVLHKLTLNQTLIDPPNEIPAWTLVFRGPIRRRWGFFTDGGWIDAKDFGRHQEAQKEREKRGQVGDHVYDKTVPK